MHDDNINEMDLLAFVDDQIDDRRKLEIETWLADRPVEAARVMRDLRDRTAIKLALQDLHPVPSPALIALAAERPRVQRPVQRPLWRRFAAMAAVVATGVILGTVSDQPFGSILIGGPPAYINDAVQSHEASLVRVGMPSRPKVPWMQAVDIRTAIRIRLPVLPQGWRLIDVQVFPSDQGPSAQLLIDTGGDGEVSLFSSQTRGDKTFQPVVVRRNGESVAFWEIEGQSFVLIGDQSRADLHDMALDLSDNQLL